MVLHCIRNYHSISRNRVAFLPCNLDKWLAAYRLSIMSKFEIDTLLLMNSLLQSKLFNRPSSNQKFVCHLRWWVRKSDKVFFKLIFSCLLFVCLSPPQIQRRWTKCPPIRKMVMKDGHLSSLPFRSLLIFPIVFLFFPLITFDWSYVDEIVFSKRQIAVYLHKPAIKDPVEIDKYCPLVSKNLLGKSRAVPVKVNCPYYRIVWL